MSAPTQEAVAVDSTAPEIEQAPHSPLPRLSRRTLLRRSAALAAGGSLAVAAGPKPALAQDPGLSADLRAHVESLLLTVRTRRT